MADADASLVIVGGGPRAAGLLERIAANAPDLLGGRRLVVHIVEPEGFGSGRIWRHDQTPLLWANTQAEDMTMFTDATCVVDGPVRPGPTFEEWTRQTAPGDLPEALVAEADRLHGMTFASRRLVHEYLAWFFWRTVRQLPSGVRVQLHRDRVIDLTQEGEHQVVQLAGRATPLRADAVLLAQGHLPARPLGPSGILADSAARYGLTYLAEEFTADADLSVLPAGENVVVRGAGLAFVDLAVLVMESRGGRYLSVSDVPGRTLEYLPSGAEPVLHVGSRRGVPYRSKITYRLQGVPVPHLRFLDAVCVESLLLQERPLELDAAVACQVPDSQDRLDLDAHDRPLRGHPFADADRLQRHVISHVEADLARRRDPRHSADLAVFNALLAVIEPLGRILSSGRLSPASLVRDVPWFFGFFSYFASGPPPQRLEELLALARAGLVRFLGPDTEVAAEPPARGVGAAFVASSPAVDRQVRARVLVEARVPAASVSGTADGLLARLFDRGEVCEQVLVDDDGLSRIPLGKLLVRPDTCQVVDAGGRPHPSRFAFGSGTSAATPGAFSRPLTNAAFFRQNDHVVRHVLRELVAVTGARRPGGDEGVQSESRTGSVDVEVAYTRDGDAPLEEVLAQVATELAARTSRPWTPRVDRGVLLRRDGLVLAAAGYAARDDDPSAGDLSFVWVAPDHRGTGLGRYAVDALHDRSADDGLRELHADVPRRFPETAHLLRSLGYRSTHGPSDEAGPHRLRRRVDRAPVANARAPRPHLTPARAS